MEVCLGITQTNAKLSQPWIRGDPNGRVNLRSGWLQGHAVEVTTVKGHTVTGLLYKISPDGSFSLKFPQYKVSTR